MVDNNFVGRKCFGKMSKKNVYPDILACYKKEFLAPTPSTIEKRERKKERTGMRKKNDQKDMRERESTKEREKGNRDTKRAGRKERE